MTDSPTDRSMSEPTEEATDSSHAEPTDEEPAADADASPLPEPVVDEAERLTRLAREAAGDEAATYREARAETLDGHGYTARVRDEDDTLVLYPDAWLDGDTVRMERVDDTDRAVEVSLSATTGEGTWTDIEAHNADIVDRVADTYGQPHAANARAFADFMGNHYLMRMDAATADHCTEFLEEYFPRNAWASAAQQAAVDTSLEYVFAVAGADYPLAESAE
ncbi:MAG: rnhA operon protein [Halonotius sp.]